jgi:hypothetical protein
MQSHFARAGSTLVQNRGGRVVREKQNALQMAAHARFFGDEQMPEVNRIERAAYQADFHDDPI